MKHRNLQNLFCLMLLVTTCLCQAQKAPTRAVFDPTSAYEKRNVQGFKVYINRRVLEHSAEATAAVNLLDAKLKEITQMLLPDRLKPLKRVAFWLEWEAKPNGAAEYHEGKEWLQENGYNPEKLRCVEIANVRNFVKWTEDNQPLMVLHELAHAYHHNVLGWEHPEVTEAFERAMSQNKYGSVDYRYRGMMRKRDAYAATNSKEYFAEITESWFGANDFYPFDADELKQYDPVGYELVEKVWGKPRRRAAPWRAKDGNANFYF